MRFVRLLPAFLVMVFIGFKSRVMFQNWQERNRVARQGELAPIHDLGIVVLAAPRDFSHYVEGSLMNKMVYAKRHGYDLIIIEESMDPSRHTAWSKLLAMKQLIQAGRHRWLWSLDVDTVITNLSFPALSLVDENYNAVISRDCNGFNTGSWMVKSSNLTIEMFDEAWKYPNAEPVGWFEQAALMIVLKEPKFADTTKVIPLRALNSMPHKACRRPQFTWHPGDFVMHYAGLDKDINDLVRKVKELHPPEPAPQSTMSAESGPTESTMRVLMEFTLPTP